jgi:hypothetical protein
MARMTIELPNDIVEMVAQTAEKESVPKTEVIRRMFTILRITQEEKRKGNDLGIVNGDKVIARFVGV